MRCKYPEEVCPHMTLYKGAAYCDDTPCTLRDELPPLTNADRIRGMSDSELAKFMYDTYSEGLVDIIRSQKQGSVQVHNREYYVDWLQQPAKGGGEA